MSGNDTKFGRILGVGLLLAAAGSLAQPPGADLEQRWGMLEQYCFGCHNFEDWAGGLDLESMNPAMVNDHPEIFEEVVRKLRGRLMPPPGQPQPAGAELSALVSSLEGTLDRSFLEGELHPGSVAIHRLNRIEYANEIKRLFALDVNPAELLPPDTRSEGFENVAEVLQVSPAFLDQYIAAARAISIRAVGDAEPRPDQYTYEAPDPLGQHGHVAGLPLGTRGGFQVEHYFPADAEYDIDLRVSSMEGSLVRSYPTGWLEYEHTLILTLDGEEVFRRNLGGEEDFRYVDQFQQQAVDDILDRFKGIRLQVPAGTHQVGVAFIAKTHAESDRKMLHTLPGLTMDSIPLVLGMNVTGPFNPSGTGDTPSRQRIFTCYPASATEEVACAGQILSRLARQAFKRPVTEADLETLMGFYQAGHALNGFESGIQRAIMAMLASPKFLYRAEEIPPDAAPGQVMALSDFELASRLSFFLWSQGPDDELLAAAEAGDLRDRDQLKRQVDRMLADPRAQALVNNFGMQWLRVADIDAIDPDPRLFPEFDPTLRAALKEELRRFVASILLEDRPVTDLLDARHTFVNERLARHYGLSSVRGDRYRRVELAESHRWGLLGKGGILMLTSYPNRTSPVMRGAYILETIVGAPPAAPPPEVETDLEDAPGAQPTTVRARLEVHRENPSCNNCHGVIDPLGLALENFDAIGKWRDRDRWAGQVIDASGQLAGGVPIQGPDDLREALVAQPRQFAQSFTEKLMTYALGRAVEHHDMPVVRRIVAQAAEDDYRFSALVLAIAESVPFGMKQVPEEEADTRLGMND